MPYGRVPPHVFLERMAGLSPGEHIAIVGASGAVGRMAVQLARALGAEVTAVCSRSHDLLYALGADHVVDRRFDDFTTHHGVYDIIFDTSGHVPFGRCREALTTRGRYLTLFMTALGLLDMAWSRIWGGQRSTCGVAFGDRELFEVLAGRMAEGSLRAVVEQRYPLEKIVEAHEHLEVRELSGDLVVECVPSGAVLSGRSRAA